MSENIEKTLKNTSTDAKAEQKFDNTKSMIPEIRFKGFNDAWEQRKLDDVAEFSKGSGYSKGDLVESGTPIILYGRLYTKYETSISDVDTYVEAKEGSIYSKGGEVIVPASGETAEDIARAATVDKSGILLGGDLNIVMPNEDINSAFLAISISTGNSQRELAKKAQGKSVVHIHNEEIRNLVVPFPTKVEQNKIVTYFSSLDNLITLHQRKYDKLVNVKKSMLEQMFPQEDETVPRIRFKGFTGAWEQRKLGDIADKAVDNRGKTPSISEEGTHPLLEVASLGSGAPDYSKVTKYLSDKTFKTELRAYIKKGDILFSTVGSIGLVSLMDTNENAAIAQNIVAFRANESYDSKFLYAMLSTEENQYKAQRIVMGAVQPSIKVSQLVDVEYFVTENIAEQRKLGEYFLNLDNLITLHQRKLEKLKNIKKSMLEKMFV